MSRLAGLFSSSARKWSLRVAGGFAVSIAAIGLLHTPMARPLMMRLGGCPMAGVHMTSVEMDNARRIALSGRERVGAAPARPALGFDLDRTTLNEAHAWAKREHVDCEDVHPGLMKCTKVSPDAMDGAAQPGAIDELTLGFNTRGQLVNITTFRAHLSPDDAARSARDIASGLSAKLGEGKHSGSFEAQKLALMGAPSIAVLSYKYDDYIADVTAMNLPSDGPSVREQYLSAND